MIPMTINVAEADYRALERIARESEHEDAPMTAEAYLSLVVKAIGMQAEGSECRVCHKRLSVGTICAECAENGGMK